MIGPNGNTKLGEDLLNPIRIALIGAGGIGAHHAARYDRLKGAELTTVVDVDEKKAQDLAQKYGLKHVFTSFDEALQANTFDAVDICLPTWLHVDMTEAAAKAGKHILCEKPMATTLHEAQRMIKAADEAGVVLLIAQCRRYDNYWGAVSRALADGAIGSPAVWRSVSGGPGPGPAWFYDRHKGLGPLVDGAIHNYDFARTMFGEATSVYATGRTFKDVTATDTGVAIITFERGDELQLSWSWGLPPGVRAGSVNEILGPEGVLFFSEPGHVDVPKAPEGLKQIVVVRRDGEVVPYHYEPNDMYLGEIQAFVDSINGERKPDPDGREGMTSLAIGLAALESIETGKIVSLKQ